MSKTPDISTRHVSEIDGNATAEVKKIIGDTATDRVNTGFASLVGRRLLVKEVSYIQKAEEPTRMECRIVVEITVDDGERALLVQSWL